MTTLFRATRGHPTTRRLEWRSDEGALEKFFPLVQPELHRLAHVYTSRERAGHTLQTSAILNEAYLRLPIIQSRSGESGPFIAAAAQLMWRVMVDLPVNAIHSSVAAVSAMKSPRF